jgi:hypothetical protein
MADTLDLQAAIQQVEADVARLRKLIDAQAATEVADELELKLPPEIKLPRREVVATYLGRHRDMLDIVSKFGVALADEFKHDCARIELDVQEDDYIDEQDLVFNVRVATYDESLMQRIDRVSDPFDDVLSRASGWVVATTDYGPVE